MVYIMAKIKGNLTRRMWKKSDDAICTYVKLSELYDNVPKELDVTVEVFEFHNFQCKTKKRNEIKKWLNKD